jgi:hypothetical protein
MNTICQKMRCLSPPSLPTGAGFPAATIQDLRAGKESLARSIYSNASHAQGGGSAKGRVSRAAAAKKGLELTALRRAWLYFWRAIAVPALSSFEPKTPAVLGLVLPELPLENGHHEARLDRVQSH